MTAPTSPQEFLCEIGGLSGLVDDLLASPINSHWHWPSYYLMYVDVDRLLGLIGQAGRLFDAPCADVDEANELFAALGQRQKSIVRWLWQMSRHTAPVGEQPGEQVRRARLRAHVHPKSGWHQTFMQTYSCGVVSADGQALARIVLPTDPGPSGERLSFLDAECMMLQQSFDIGTLESRLALAHAAGEAERRLAKTVAAMSAFLSRNCRIEDLLHPSSF